MNIINFKTVVCWFISAFWCRVWSFQLVLILCLLEVRSSAWKLKRSQHRYEIRTEQHFKSHLFPLSIFCSERSCRNFCDCDRNLTPDTKSQHYRPLKGPGQWGQKQNIWLSLAYMFNCPPEPLRCTYTVYALHRISAPGCLWPWAVTLSSLVSPYEAGQRWRQSTCTEQVAWCQAPICN